MQKINSVVAVYGDHSQAEEALRAFQSSGFDMKQLSIVGKDYHTEEHVIGFYNTGDRMKFWGKRGAFWGGFWAVLFGSALFLIPGFGHVMVLGPLAGWIVGVALKSCCRGREAFRRSAPGFTASEFPEIAFSNTRRRSRPISSSSSRTARPTK